MPAPDLAPIGPLDACRSLWLGGQDTEKRVESHRYCQWFVAGEFVGIGELEDPLAVFFDDGPELRRCDGRGEEHLLLQFCRALDDGSGFFGVSLLDEEVLD